MRALVSDRFVCGSRIHQGPDGCGLGLLNVLHGTSNTWSHSSFTISESNLHTEIQTRGGVSSHLADLVI